VVPKGSVMVVAAALPDARTTDARRLLNIRPRNAHDVLTMPPSSQNDRGGRRAAKKPPAASGELQPFKIIGQLVGVLYDADGNIVGEEVMGEVAIYRPNFGRVEQLIDEAIDQAHSASASSRS
jgi:hypothetical protein